MPAHVAIFDPGGNCPGPVRAPCRWDRSAPSRTPARRSCPPRTGSSMGVGAVEPAGHARRRRQARARRRRSCLHVLPLAGAAPHSSGSQDRWCTGAIRDGRQFDSTSTTRHNRGLCQGGALSQSGAAVRRAGGFPPGVQPVGQRRSPARPGSPGRAPAARRRRPACRQGDQRQARKSIGMTTPAGAIDSAVVRQKCATARRSDQRQPRPRPAEGRAMSPSAPAQTRPKTACIAVSQNRMQVSVSDRVSLRG